MPSSCMPDSSFAESQTVKEISPDVFQNLHPPWTWPNSTVIPGGLLMSLCAASAWHTVPKHFVLDNLQAQFLGGPSTTNPMTFRVTRLSNGRRFAARSVSLEQNNTVMLAAMITFVSATPWTGPAMTHAAARKTRHKVDEITVDDLAEARGPHGSFMRFQRLPLLFTHPSRAITSGIATSVAQIIPPVTRAEEDTPATHILGVINLSDYHVMDAPMQLNGITFGLRAIGDATGPATPAQMRKGTSLNHAIYFHVHAGFRADGLSYIEAETVWGRDGRALITSKIFAGEGDVLIATCVQEAFYVLKDGVLKDSATGSKL